MNEIKLDTLPASGCDDSSNNDDVYDQACNDDFSEETTDMTTNDKKSTFQSWLQMCLFAVLCKISNLFEKIESTRLILNVKASDDSFW